MYNELLAQGLVEPKALNLFVANIDGSDARQVTDLPGANWAPFFYPDGQRIIFASNHHTLDQGGREFDLFLIGVDGTGLERVTHSGTFDAFAMFSFAGDKLVFASNRLGRYDLYTMAADGSDVRRLTTGGDCFTPDWSRVP